MDSFIKAIDDEDVNEIKLLIHNNKVKRLLLIIIRKNIISFINIIL